MHPIINHINGRHDKGLSTTIVICGGTGKGKSITGLAMLLLLSKLFKIDVNLEKSVYMKIDKFMMDFIKSQNNIFIMDEAKTELGAKEWYSKLNTFFANILATQRYRKNVYIIILPLAKTLAKDHRDMIDVIIEMKDKGWASTYIIGRRWSEIQKFELWKFYVGDMIIKLPDKKIVEEYELIGNRKKEEIYLDMVGQVLGQRRCICGYPMDFMKQDCKYCGFRFSQQDIYTLIRNKLT